MNNQTLIDGQNCTELLQETISVRGSTIALTAQCLNWPFCFVCKTYTICRKLFVDFCSHLQSFAPPRNPSYILAFMTTFGFITFLSLSSSTSSYSSGVGMCGWLEARADLVESGNLLKLWLYNGEAEESEEEISGDIGTSQALPCNSWTSSWPLKLYRATIYLGDNVRCKFGFSINGWGLRHALPFTTQAAVKWLVCGSFFG